MEAKDHLLFAIFEDLGEEVRKRRDPEYIYTAAAVGGFGAVSWGVASLSAANPQRILSGWADPPSVAAFLTGGLAAAVIFKIIKDHRVYMELRNDEVRVVGLLAKSLGANVEELPTRYRRVGPARGYLWSILVVVVSAFAAIAFCLSVKEALARPSAPTGPPSATYAPAFAAAITQARPSRAPPSFPKSHRPRTA